jgi:hypothetical protein
MSALEQLAQVEHRGRMMRSFCQRVRARGDVALVEETIDLPKLRDAWRALHRRAFGVARLDQLGPTPINHARVAELRRRIARRRT